MDLADGRGLSVDLRDGEKDTDYNEWFLLDYLDIFSQPTVARIHMMAGMPKDVSFEEKIRRMELWASALTVYDSMMTQERYSHLERSEIEKLLAIPRIPRVQIAIGETATVGLRKLFTELQFETEKKPLQNFLIPWEKLISLASSGELVSTWKRLKEK